jgi:SulP family sulfate permease
MDVAAIQADSPRELDYNAELVTVGLSNLLAAGAGVGFTGSYIFSQTLFSMRMGVDTPLMGIMLAGGQRRGFGRVGVRRTGAWQLLKTFG